MTTLLQRLSKGMFIIAVIGGLAFGATQAAQGMPTATCGEDPGEMGECPPFNNDLCAGVCFLAHQTIGECIPHQGGPDCCTCFME